MLSFVGGKSPEHRYLIMRNNDAFSFKDLFWKKKGFQILNECSASSYYMAVRLGDNERDSLHEASRPKDNFYL